MNVIIIEDEKPSARRLQRMLTALNMETETMLHSVEESIAWFQNNEHPDLIFLDIQLIFITAWVIFFPSSKIYEKWFKDLPNRNF